MKIFGKTTGHVAWEGDLDLEKIAGLLSDVLGQLLDTSPAPPWTYPIPRPRNAKPFPDDEAARSGQGNERTFAKYGSSR